MKRIAIFLALLCFASQHVHAQPGTLDETFGENGFVTVKVDGRGVYPFDLEQLPDAKILHSGWMTDPSSGGYIYLMKHNYNGSIDTTFGYKGTATYYANGGTSGANIYVYPDGRILLYGGRMNVHIQRQHPSLIRFLPNGTVDESFGVDGGFMETSSGSEAQFLKLRVQPDGSMIALGRQYQGTITSPIWRATITRIKPNGTLDSSFGLNGVKIVGPENDSGFTRDAIFYQGDRCVFSRTFEGVPTAGAKLFCTDLNGKLDSTFGTNGVISAQFSDAVDFVAGIADGSDEKIVCAIGMVVNEAYYKSVVTRFLKDGRVDSSFGNNGVAQPLGGTFEQCAYSVTVDSGKNVLNIGYSFDSQQNIYPSHISCYDARGKLDPSFAGDGICELLSTHMPHINTNYNPMTVQRDAKYLIAGNGRINDRNVAVITRMINTGKLHTTSQPKPIHSLTLHPTPSSDNCTVTYTLNASGNCIMTLRDESGREVKTFATSGFRTVGEHKEELDLRGLASGVYFLQIESGGAIQTAKLIKQ
jgi:uncharacterized delta-60 repeat protein